MKTYKGKISELGENQVFVFGSNLDGFHGGGAAGFASFGAGVGWRDVNYAAMPSGWKGLWNVKGVGIGYQEGTNGRSYALPTVIHAGMPRSLTLDQIAENIKVLYKYAVDNPELEFLIAYTLERNLNGYSSQDMAECFGRFEIPENVVFEEMFAIGVGKCMSAKENSESDMTDILGF